jgi:hypothetical protein
MELQFELPFQDHHQLVRLMDVILPHLTGRINPQAARKAAPIPISGDMIVIYHIAITGSIVFERRDAENGCVPYEQPLVAPQPMHFKQVPFRTIINRLHS